MVLETEKDAPTHGQPPKQKCTDYGDGSLYFLHTVKKNSHPSTASQPLPKTPIPSSTLSLVFLSLYVHARIHTHWAALLFPFLFFTLLCCPFPPPFRRGFTPFAHHLPVAFVNFTSFLVNVDRSNSKNQFDLDCFYPFSVS